MVTAIQLGRPNTTVPARSFKLHSVKTWVAVIPIIFFAVGGSFSFQGAGNSTMAGNSLSGLASSGRSPGILGYAIWGIAYSIVLWLIVINARCLLPVVRQMKIITLLAVLAICSALWSQDPTRSAISGIFYLIETLFAFYLVLRFDPEEIMSIVMMAGASISILSLILVFLFPHFGVMQSARDGLSWNGVFGDRTTAGKCMVFLLSPAIIFGRRLFSYHRAIYVALLSIMVFMAHSATARLILIVYIALMALLSISRGFGRRSSLLIVGMFLAGGMLTLSVGLQFLPRVLEAMGRNATLTGRTGIWMALVGSVAKRPLLGYGYHAFWQGLKGESANVILATHWVFGYAHNGFLEICLQLGLVGLALFFVTLLQAIRNAWFCYRGGCSPSVEWYVGLIVLTIAYNIDECTVLWPQDLLSILYIIACCGLAVSARQIKQIKTIEAMYS